MNANLAAEMEATITAIVAELCPDARGRTMYGGTVFEKEPGNPKTGIGGVFCYTGHVSVEFSKGVMLDDPDGLLEGKGKTRRHLKLRSLAEITQKNVEHFLRQAILL